MKTEPERFTIENGVLYFGRTNTKHGFNLGDISNTAFNTLEILNMPLEEMERLNGVLAAYEQDGAQHVSDVMEVAVGIAAINRFHRLVESLKELPVIVVNFALGGRTNVIIAKDMYKVIEEMQEQPTKWEHINDTNDKLA